MLAVTAVPPVKVKGKADQKAITKNNPYSDTAKAIRYLFFFTSNLLKLLYRVSH